MLNDLTKEQRRLADFMSDLSEKCYSASWLENLEYVLWDTLTKGERKFGQYVISQHDINELSQLSKGCNCWVYYDNITEETAINLELWKHKFDQLINQNREILKG